MQLFDVVDEYGCPTGDRVTRSDAHRLGIRHRTAHVWIARKHEGRWQVLLQKRADAKDSFPGCFDTSSAGHIKAGDEPLPSAIRELQEELGITAAPNQLKPIGTFPIAYERTFHGKIFRDNEVSFVYVYTEPVQEQDLKLQEEEVSAVQWFDVEDLDRALHPRDPLFCVPVEGFELVKRWLSSQS